MKRLIIYFHYDSRGCIDAPCRFAVEAMTRCGDVFFVTNGTPDAQSRMWAQRTAVQYLERENAGLDVGAYRAALLQLGRAGLQSYDELVLMNFTLAGPVTDPQTMFAAMQARPELGFWGLTRHYAMKSRRFGGNVPEHLQSHFLALRPQLFNSDAFWNYWQDMKLPQSYEESVIRHETRFTAHFTALGYAWDSYVDTADLKSIFVNPIMACPRELLETRGCPFFKRRSLFTDYADELRRTDGMASRELYDFVKTQTGYPIETLLDALLQTVPLAELSKNLHWHTVLQTTPAVMQGENFLKNADLRLIKLPQLPADAVTAYYLNKAAAVSDTLISQLVTLFEQDDRLGIVSPALPLWAGAQAARTALWRQSKASLAGTLHVPLSDDPPPVPNAGWALVRMAAFPQGLPEITSPARGWLLPLTAQQNGYTCLTFETAAQAAARTEQLEHYVAQSTDAAALTKQLGRVVKHTLL